MSDISNFQLDKYFHMSIKYYKLLNKSKRYKLIKKLFYSTQLKGPHMDFYNSPFGFNKTNTIDNFIKFQKKIVKSIDNLLFCEKQGMFLHKVVISAILEQLNHVILTSDIYWTNLGFSNEDAINIKKTYEMYKLFLETYISRSTFDRYGDLRIGEKIYKMCLKSHLSIDISPDNLQKFGLMKMKKIILRIEKITRKNIFEVLTEYASNGTPVGSETELASLAMTHILSLYEKAKITFEGIEIPEPHKIKIKAMPTLREKWSSKGLVSGRYLFLNMSQYNSYMKEQLLRLCAHETIPGHIMYRLLTSKSIDDYFSRNKKNKKIRKFITSGFKGLHEGLASYAETIMKDMYTDQITLLISQLFHAVRIVVDTAVNSSKVDIKFTADQAKKFMKSFTLLSDAGIQAEITRYLSNPGQACSYCIGSCIFKSLEKSTIKKGYTIQDFYKIIYSSPFPFTILTEYVNNLPSK